MKYKFIFLLTCNNNNNFRLITFLNFGYNKMNKNTKHLTDEQYRVTQQHGTEVAYTGAYWDNKEVGNYNCIWCDALLFSSEAK